MSCRAESGLAIAYRRPERTYQNARVFICEPESTKLLEPRRPWARMGRCVRSRFRLYFARSAAAVLLIESGWDQARLLGGPSPF